MTRPRAASETFVADLPKDKRAQVAPLYSPLIAIQGLGVRPTISPNDAVIFTSRNAVAHGPDGQDRHAFCVGPATTIAAHKMGWVAQMRGETADALVEDMVQNPPHQSLIHLSGVHTRGDISARLNAQGVQATNVAVYEQIAQPLSTQAREIIEGEKPVLVPLFSPRTSAQFVAEVPLAAAVRVVALSYAVAQQLEAASYAGITVASAPNANAMRSAIGDALADLSSG